ncbi:Nicalin-1 [Hypsibius exemplaris]|uniref:BOS complex subunit NCLN n=1 Tax=Hypsibius exemplaris TaxID=2072580 RepID=A0A9X6ND46_HYPEX|nr:Nicalin-1 [Hypsibius exemplaris]
MGADSAWDLFTHSAHSVLWLLIVPLTIILVGPAIRPAQAVHHFTFHRMQHYEFGGSVRGSPGVALNCEVRTLFAASVARRCLVLSWKEFLSADLTSIVNKGIVALVIAVPQNLSSILGEDRDLFIETEQTLLGLELQIPVYMVEVTPTVTEWLGSLSLHLGHSAPQTATEELLQQVTGDYYYLSSSLYAPKQITDVKITNFVGRLGQGPAIASESQPVILLVAHLDAAGIAPSLSYGANSDASGVAVILETIRVLEKLFKSQKSPPKSDIMVLVSGAGKFNYFGTKKWLDETAEGSDAALLTRIQYAVCLDGVGKSDQLRAFVSRPPREGSASFRVLEALNFTATDMSSSPIALVHKKINLAEDELAWEHEQFSLAKVPAFTLSTLVGNRPSERKSILDSSSGVDIDKLTEVTHILAKTLAAEMYGLNDSDTNVLHSSFLAVSRENLVSWMDLLTQQPRSLQTLVPEHPAVSAVKDYLTRHLSELNIKQLTTDKGDSDLVLYGPLEVSVTASRTKQPFFDLLVTTIIGIYGGILFLLIQYVDVIGLMRKLLTPLVVGSGVKLRTVKSLKYQ